MMNITPTVKQLLIINIIFFVGSALVPQANQLLALHTLQSDDFGVWQLITHIFMHGNLMHIAFNMFALYSFGSALEHFWGPKKFIFFYISCGLGAAALQLGITYMELQGILKGLADAGLSNSTLHQIYNIDNVWNPVTGQLNAKAFTDGVRAILQDAGKLQAFTNDNLQLFASASANVNGIMVGASGAIYGLLIAFAFMFPNAELLLMFIPIPIKAKYFVPFLLAYDLIAGVYGSSLFGGGDGVAHFAHIGGAIIGYLMMWYWKRQQFNQNRWN
ncbi:MAG: rhomboid family intramembrane serine protease [Flavobacterium sp.]|nr:MAG: rhomboid family intramembrane serine protease [Flavobacterium sp.]